MADGSAATDAVNKGQLDAFREEAAKIKEQIASMSAKNQAALANAHLTLELALLIGGSIAGFVAVALIWLLSRSIVTPIVGAVYKKLGGE